MPQCSFKKCKNHTSRTLKRDGISYFRFPRDPVRCGEWISVIARQRSEEFFKATQGSVVCSKHFLQSDVYVTTNGIRRLHKTAVPRIEANDHDEENESSFDKKQIGQCCLQPQINIEPRVAEVLKSPTSSLSIGSNLDTPKKVVMKKELLACKRLLTVKNQKISNLRKQNNRLKKKYNNLKDVLCLLNKRQTVDQSLLHDLSNYE